MLFWVVIAVAAIFFFRWFLQPDAGKIVGIYSQPGKWYWLKFRVMRFVIALRQRRTIKAADKKSRENLMNSQWGGDGGERTPEAMDSKHVLPKDKPRAADCVFFDASNREGFYFALGTAQRHDDVINFFCVVKIPNVGTFVAKEMFSDTNVKSVHTDDREWRTASGFSVRCEEPMKKWRLTYKGQLYASPGRTIFDKNGPLVESADLQPVPAEFDFTWDNFGDCFDFDKQCSPTAIAHSIAIEPWSRALFDKMRSSHQSHYEQFGFLNGKLKVGDNEYGDLRMTSMRDHTITGYRSWADLRRYIMMIFHLEDGTCVHTSVISMPETVFTHLEFGYMVTPDKKLVPVDRVHFSLPNHGEDRHFPNKFHYSFEAGGHTYNVDVNIIDVVSFKMGLDNAAQVNENMAEFTMNGVNGWGFSECEYRIQPY